MPKNFLFLIEFSFRSHHKNIALHLYYPHVFLEVFFAEKDGRGEERGERHPKISVENWERAP